MNPRSGLLDRELLLKQAHFLITSPKFDHEANARANALTTLAERLRANGYSAAETTPEMREFTALLRSGIQTRDMTVTSDSGGGYLIPVGFADQLLSALKAVDALFSPDVVNLPVQMPDLPVARGEGLRRIGPRFAFRPRGFSGAGLCHPSGQKGRE